MLPLCAFVVLAGASCSATIKGESTSGDASTSSAGGATSAGSGGAANAGGAGGAGGTTGAGGGTVTGTMGGKLDTLSFAVVGDTRPANQDDLPGYPTAVISKIWQDVQAASPRPAFAVTTGDYMFASPSGTQSVLQLQTYLTARAVFSNPTFPAMGNHECTGSTTSNCGQGNANSITQNYANFMAKMLAPLGVKNPWYTLEVGSTTGAWTAKFVIIAANAWSTAQSTWLDTELAKPTTYTFVIRHESVNAATAPGVTPSEAILAKHPYTIAIVGHTHEYRYAPQDREVIVGNGGAPLSGQSNYGYVIARQRQDGAIVFTSYDYMTNKAVDTFALKADGTAAP
jgi:hypothetical protein